MSPETLANPLTKIQPSSRGDWETHLFMDWSWTPHNKNTILRRFELEVRNNKNIPKHKRFGKVPQNINTLLFQGLSFFGADVKCQSVGSDKTLLAIWQNLNPFGPRCIGWSTSFHLPATQLLCQLFLPVHVLAPKHWVFHSFGALDLNQKTFGQNGTSLTYPCQTKILQVSSILWQGFICTASLMEKLKAPPWNLAPKKTLTNTSSHLFIIRVRKTTPHVSHHFPLIKKIELLEFHHRVGYWDVPGS